MSARQMLMQLRDAVFIAAMLAVVGLSWEASRPWVLAGIILVSVLPLVAQAGEEGDEAERRPFRDPDGNLR